MPQIVTIFGFYPGLLSGDAALSSMLPLLQHDDAVDCVPLVYPATPLEADHGTLHGFSDELLRVPPMTNVIYSKPFIANTWSATSTWDAIKAIAVAPRIILRPQDFYAPEQKLYRNLVASLFHLCIQKNILVKNK
ncbi:hypothetical protein MRX96_034537 [Rhipicephalus microplus]